MVRFRLVIKKLHQYFFGKEEVIKEKETDEWSTARTVGRIVQDRYDERDFIRQYPKTGKFRFPLEVDDVPADNFSVEKHKERPKFSNRNFQARNVPSPVYGFRERKKRPLEGAERKEIEAEAQKQAYALSQGTSESFHGQRKTLVEQSYVSVQDRERIGKLSAAPLSVRRKEEMVSVSHDFFAKTNEPEPSQELTPVSNEASIEKTQKENEPVTKIQENDVPETQEKDHFAEEKMEPKEPLRAAKEKDYCFPPLYLLKKPMFQEDDDSDFLFEQADRLEETLHSFQVSAMVVDVTKGPSVTRFEVQPAPGVKVSKITSLADDIKLALAAKDIRIEAPIPGKHAIGIEVPNLKSKPVLLYDIIADKKFQDNPSPLTVALGLDIAGEAIVTDLKKMPHGLIAGATGSGKSVCINSIIVSLLYKAAPDEVKLMLIDPKMVELLPYNNLPHLIAPVITDVKKATAALIWAVNEMERRYELFSQNGVRDIQRYNAVRAKEERLPYIVIIIDELADLMMVSAQDVEESICRIAQKARACGIHLLLATQRPSVDVITGLIKANIPTRIAFAVSSQADSRTILDMSGAERLLGKGDMLFHENGAPKPVRVQGTYISDEEIEAVVSFVKQQRDVRYEIKTDDLVRAHDHFEQDDELFAEACYFVIEQGAASASLLQRRFRIGYNRAARLIDMMESYGIVSEASGSKPRNVLMTLEQFEQTVLQGNHS